MDICTLTLAATMTTGLCYEPPRCVDHGGRRLCTPLMPKSCGEPPHYVCKRPDGTEYRFMPSDSAASSRE